MNVIVIDPTSRGIQTFIASTTRGEDNGTLFLRHALNMGSLHELGEFSAVGDFGLVLLRRSYAAKESSGFTRIYEPDRKNPSFKVTGACGCMGAKSLREIKPQQAWVWTPGNWIIQKIQTHCNSNTATAAAARDGLALLASVRNTLILAEGQSDKVVAWSIGPAGARSFQGNKAGNKLEPRYGEALIDQGGQMTMWDWAAIPVEHHKFSQQTSTCSD